MDKCCGAICSKKIIYVSFVISLLPQCHCSPSGVLPPPVIYPDKVVCITYINQAGRLKHDILRTHYFWVTKSFFS